MNLFLHCALLSAVSGSSGGSGNLSAMDVVGHLYTAYSEVLEMVNVLVVFQRAESYKAINREKNSYM